MPLVRTITKTKGVQKMYHTMITNDGPVRVHIGKTAPMYDAMQAYMDNGYEVFRDYPDGYVLMRNNKTRQQVRIAYDDASIQEGRC